MFIFLDNSSNWTISKVALVSEELDALPWKLFIVDSSSFECEVFLLATSNCYMRVSIIIWPDAPLTQKAQALGNFANLDTDVKLEWW